MNTLHTSRGRGSPSLCLPKQSIGLLLQRIAGNQLDPRRAGLLLYALQIASSNLPKAEKNAPSPPVETVEEITLDDLRGP